MEAAPYIELNQATNSKPGRTDSKQLIRIPRPQALKVLLEETTMASFHSALTGVVAALLGLAAASSALAADVQVYGRVDLGLSYKHVDSGTDEGSYNTFTMDPSNGTSSRFGLRGSEDLGNGYQVKFVLENGFNPDTGEFATSGRIFDRESTLQLHGDFGAIAFGRESILGTDGGSFNMLGNVNPFGTGIGIAGNQNMILGKLPATRYDNAITYRTPKMAGFQMTAMYSFGDNEYEDDETGAVKPAENKSLTNRYTGLGVTYTNGALSTVLLYEGVNEGSAERKDPEDMWRITLGGNYDFGFMRLYALAHYFKNADALSSTGGWDSIKQVGSFTLSAMDELKGYGGILGLDTPLAGGKLLVGLGGQKAETSEAQHKFEADTWFGALGWQYQFSKTARFYSALSYVDADYTYDGETVDPSAVQVVSGISVYF